MNVISPNPTNDTLRVGIVVARFNAFVTEPLLQGALKALERQGVPETQIDVVWAPGAFEIPVLLQSLAARDRVDSPSEEGADHTHGGYYDALIALGCVIRGDTAHFDYVCSACTEGVTRISLDYGVAIGFGLLTTDTSEQATARAGDNRDNKGLEAVLAALETVGLQRTIEQSYSHSGAHH